MMMIILLTCLICSFIVIICLTGDHLLSVMARVNQGNSHVLRALTDSSTHALVGAFTWAVVENDGLLIDWRKWANCIFCAFLAASVDIDHFIAARSFSLKKALQLDNRPVFHNTTLIPAVLILCWLLSYRFPVLKVLSLMFVSSWLSHHLRDANHRGLWLFPFGNTPTFSSALYISLILSLALIVRVVYYYSFVRLKSDHNDINMV